MRVKSSPPPPPPALLAALATSLTPRRYGYMSGSSSMALCARNAVNDVTTWSRVLKYT